MGRRVGVRGPGVGRLTNILQCHGEEPRNHHPPARGLSGDRDGWTLFPALQVVSVDGCRSQESAIVRSGVISPRRWWSLHNRPECQLIATDRVISVQQTWRSLHNRSDGHCRLRPGGQMFAVEQTTATQNRTPWNRPHCKPDLTVG